MLQTSIARLPGDVLVVDCDGELDLSTAPLLDAALREAEDGAPSSVLLDLEDVPFLDSSAMALLLRAHRRLLAAHIGLALLRPQERPRSYLHRTGVDSVLAIADSVLDAVARAHRLVSDAKELQTDARRLRVSARRTRARRRRNGEDGARL